MGYSKKFGGNFRNFMASSNITGQLIDNNMEITSIPHYLQRHITERDFNYQLRQTTKSVPILSPQGIEEVFTPVLDKIEFRDVGSDFKKKNFFSKLKILLHNKKRDSLLVNHFAKCEKLNLAYTDPELPFETLLKRTNVNFATNFTEHQKIGTYYSTNGGQRVIERIIELDKDFFLFISLFSESHEATEPYGIKLEVCRFDLCSKLTEPIMPRVTDQVKKGHVWGNGCHLYAIGTLNNEPFSARVGRQSKAYPKIQDPNNLQIESLYVGDNERAFRVLFYDKAKEVFKKGKSLSEINTHVELRVNCLKANLGWSFYQRLFMDYFGPAASYFRTNFMLKYMYESVAMTTKQRITNKNLMVYEASLADWWTNSYIAPMQELIDLHLGAVRFNLSTKKKCSIFLQDNQHPIYSEVYKDMELAKKHPDGFYRGHSYFLMHKHRLHRVKDYVEALQNKASWCLEKVTHTNAINYFKKLINRWTSFDSHRDAHGIFFETSY